METRSEPLDLTEEGRDRMREVRTVGSPKGRSNGQDLGAGWRFVEGIARGGGLDRGSLDEGRSGPSDPDNRRSRH